MANKRLFWVLAVLLSVSATVQAATMQRIVCDVIVAVYGTLMLVAPSLVLIMFIYGGVKYTFSADDPGGRKQAKMTCIHAIIGGILLVLIAWVRTTVLAGWSFCTGI